VQYALLINVAPGAFEALDANEQEAVSAEYYTIRADPRMIGGAHLAPANTASTVRILVATEPERRFLHRRITELDSQSSIPRSSGGL
jgi:hypothetical protein